jgi:hypothetical protein
VDAVKNIYYIDGKVAELWKSSADGITQSNLCWALPPFCTDYTYESSNLAMNGAGYLYNPVPTEGRVRGQSLVGGGMDGRPWGVTLENGLYLEDAIAVDGSGNVYVSAGASGFSNLLKLSADGTQTTLATGFNRISALALDAVGNVYVGDVFYPGEQNYLWGGGRVLKVSADGLTQRVLWNGGSDGTGMPFAIAVDAAANVYIAEHQSDDSYVRPRADVLKVAGDGSGVTTMFDNIVAVSLAVDGAGSLYIGSDTDITFPGYPERSNLGVVVKLPALPRITFNPLPDLIYGAGPITIAATSSSFLPMTYSVTGPATLSGSVLAVTGAGKVTVTATQLGSQLYSAATPVSRGFVVNPAVLTVRRTQRTKSREVCK